MTLGISVESGLSKNDKTADGAKMDLRNTPTEILLEELQRRYLQAKVDVPEYVIERFWHHVAKSDGCWHWIGHKRRGYGFLTWEGPFGMVFHVAAHRLSYRLANGEFDQSLCVCHTCDTADCVNPDHLALGTRGQNTADAYKRGLIKSGSNHHWAKLTEHDIRTIRMDFRGDQSRYRLASKYGVHPGHINKIVTGERWKHSATVGSFVKKRFKKRYG